MKGTMQKMIKVTFVTLFFYIFKAFIQVVNVLIYFWQF